jgi:hypothetical protein
VEKEQEEIHFFGWECNAETPDPKEESLPKREGSKRRHPQGLALPSSPGQGVKNNLPETRYIRFLGGSISQSLNLKKRLNTRGKMII